MVCSQCLKRIMRHRNQTTRTDDEGVQVLAIQQLEIKRGFWDSFVLDRSAAIRSRRALNRDFDTVRECVSVAFNSPAVLILRLKSLFEDVVRSILLTVIQTHLTLTPLPQGANLSIRQPLSTCKKNMNVNALAFVSSF